MFGNFNGMIQMCQQMMNSGRVSQAQYDQAVRMAQQIQGMLTPGGRR
jgi:predicted RNA-binding protein associated with RNAse of E/G family